MGSRKLGRIGPKRLTAWPHHNLLHPKARGLELGLAVRLEAGPAGIDVDRPFQGGLSGFQLGDDPLQLFEGLLE